MIHRRRHDRRQQGKAPAPAFAGAPYSVGGKTGTARSSRLKGQSTRNRPSRKPARPRPVHRLRPVDNPKIALAVLVENGGFGAQSAAPIAHGDRLLSARQDAELPAGRRQGRQRRHRGGANEDDGCGRNPAPRLARTAIARIDFPLLLITAAIMGDRPGTDYSATYDSSTA